MRKEPNVVFRPATILMGSVRHLRRSASIFLPLILLPAVLYFILPDSSQPADRSVIDAMAPVELLAEDFRELRGVAVDAGGSVYVADRRAGTVTLINPDRSKKVVASHLERPIGLALDLEGRLLIAEEKAGQISRLEETGSRALLVEGVKQPRWLALGEDGTLFFSARRLTRGTDPEPDDESAEPEAILTLTAGGRLIVFSEGFKNLQGIAVDGNVLYAAAKGLKNDNRTDGVIFKIPILPDGTAGPRSLLAPSNIFKRPIGLAVDLLGSAYFTTEQINLSNAKSNRAIAKLSPDRTLSVFAAQLKDPQGLAFDREGSLYLADGNSGRLFLFRAPSSPTLVFPSFTNQLPLVLQGTIEPNSRIDALLNDSAFQRVSTLEDGAFTLSLDLLQNAQNFLQLFAIAHNGQGLTGSPTKAEIIHDNIPPVIVNLQPTNGSFLNNSIPVLSSQFLEAGSGIDVARFRIQLDGTDVTPQHLTDGGFTLSPGALSETFHAAVVTLFDRAGNSASVSTSFAIDITPPESQITGGPQGEIGEATATFIFTGTDNQTPTEGLQFAWRLDGGPWSAFSSTKTIALNTLTEGGHLFEVKARDLAGNEDSAPASRDFSVIFGPVIASFSPGSGTIGAELTIQGRGFEPAPGNTLVKFNGTRALITGITQTTIETFSPMDATTGPITVETSKGTTTSAEDFVVMPRQDFALSASPAVGIAVQGTSRTYAIHIMSTGVEPFAGLAVLAVNGLPAGVTASFSPSVLGPGTGTLSLTPSNSTPIGSSVIEVQATASIKGRSVTQTVMLTLSIQAPGQTILAGEVKDGQDKPLSGVSIKQGGAAITELGRTDAGGNFFIPLSVTGSQVFLIDGSTANTATINYSTIPVTLNIMPGVVNTLGFVPKLHGQPVAKLIPMTPGQEAILTDPAIPGFQIMVPNGVQIIGWDGQPNTQFGITAVPIDSSPLPPLPPELAARQIYLFNFGKMGGGIPTGNIPIDTPNDVGGLPGEKIDLYYFNEAPDGTAPNRWEKYGTGTISADGGRIVTDINPATGLQYGIPRFCCGARANVPPSLPPRPGGGLSGGKWGAGQMAGEPVDTATGFFYMDKTDMVLPGILPTAITRTYRNELTNAGPFGLGTSWPYDIFLEPPPNDSPDSLILFTPGNRQDLFARQPNGKFTNTASPVLRGAEVTVVGGVRLLRFKDGNIWRFDLAGRLINQTDRNGNALTLIRDGQGRVTQIMEPSGRGLVMSYTGGNLRIDRIWDPIGRETRYIYDGAGRLTSAIDPAGGITGYTYDSSNRMISITDPRGITFLTNEYDSSGRVIRQTQADGGAWLFAYTTSGNFISRTTVTDPRGYSTTYRFNADGFLISQTDALGQTASFERQGGTNLVLSTTDNIGRITRFTYDSNGNVTRVTDPAGNVRRFEYEPIFNKLSRIIDPLNRVTLFEYDANGSLVAAVDPLGARATIAYNQFGQPVSTTDPIGNSTTFTYDSLGNLTVTTDPLGNQTHRTYDLVSRLTEQTDPRGRSTRFSYDSLNRNTHIVDALSGTTTFSYDGNGNLLTVTDARGGAITHVYESMDRLATRIDQVGAVETFEYDALGNLTLHTDRKGQVSTFGYDALSRRVVSNYADGVTTSFIYDAAGRLGEIASSIGGTVLNSYDILDRLFVQTTIFGTVRYEYDALGLRTRMDVTGSIPVTYSYDAGSRLSRIAKGTQAVDIAYDALGRRTRVTLPNGVYTEYQYDETSRINELTYRNATGILGNLTYQYDAAGNRIAVGGSFAKTFLPDPVANTSYDAANRQLIFGEKAASFDTNGNLTSISEPSGTTAFVWDARNQLIALDSPGIAASFAYDPYGRRVEKVINGQRSQYQYDTINIISELNNGDFLSYFRGLSVDELFGIHSGTGVRYATTDTLGSIINLHDREGLIQAEYQYGPFGQSRKTGEDGGNPFQFTGRENDGTGLNYNRFRYYHPLLGRFISEDPLRPLAGTDLNLYTYVSNSPLNAVDPFGLYEEDVHRDLTYFLARKAGLSVSAAQRIAATNQGLDDNEATSPFASVQARRDWHFTTPERRAELWQVALDGDLHELGHYLHALQDSYSHEGYPAWRGHFPSHAPDKTYNDPEKANRMARDTYNHIRMYLQHLSGQPIPDHWEQIRDQVDRFNRARTTHQKRKILGK